MKDDPTEASGDAPSATFSDGTAPPRSAFADLPVLGDRYRVLGMLGGGGMGNVYLAHDLELEENVAVKLLKAKYSENHRQLEMLRREVKFGRRVTHPNVLRTYDIGDHEGAKFITMELVEGGTLADLLPARTLSFSEVAKIARAICAGLGAAHDAGVMHRDLKPSNVLLATDGRILLSDFGIARLAEVTSSEEALEFAGTPGYMPPELLANEPIDLRADIWALGALLYELLVGQRAYPSKRDELLRPLFDAPPDPHERRPEMPLAVARVVTRCMARQPAARFDHPREVIAALDAAFAFPAAAAASSPGSLNVSAKRPRTLAVLPFANLGGRPEDAHLSEGMTALLISNLSSAKMRVPSRGAVEEAGLLGRDALLVGRDLGAEAVVTGSIARTDAAHDVTIEIKVTGTGDGLILFDERSVVPIADLVSTAENASRAIAERLLVERKAEAIGAHDGAAIDLYFKGMYQYRRRWETAILEAVEYLRQALERAPDDVMILSAYALALSRRLSFGGTEEETAQLRAVTERALKLDRERPEPHLAMASLSLQFADNVAAAQSIRRALTLAPYFADAHQYRGLLTFEVIGAAESLPQLYTAVTLDPTQRHVHWWAARAHAMLGELDRCDALFGAPPEDPLGLNDYWVTRTRALFYHPTKEREASFLADLSRTPHFALKQAISAVFALRRGEKTKEGESVLAKAFAPLPGNISSNRRVAYLASVKAEIASALGNNDAVMGAITEADQTDFIDVVWLDHCPLLSSVRARADFQEIRTRVEARAAKVRSELH